MPTLAMRSLAGGEVSEALKARINLPNRLAGMRRQINWLTTRDGGLRNRAGFVYCGGEAKSADSRVRLIPFVFDATDALVLELGQQYLRFWKDGARVYTGSSVSAWALATDYEPGDLVTDGGAYYLCVFTHTSASGTQPSLPKADHWHQLVAAASASDGAILEWPTPYTLSELSAVDLDYDQVYDVVTFTNDQHAPHELRRYGATDWTFLPARNAPAMEAPSDITTVDSGTAGSPGFDLSYRVTAIRNETNEESLPGWANGTGGTAVGQGTDATFFDSDLYFNDVAHGLADGDEVYIEDVTLLATRGSENVAIFLKDRIFRVKVDTADYFWLEDTAGLIELSVTSPGWPGCTITWRRASLDFTGRVKPKNAASTKISFSWTAVDGAREYWIFRSDNGSDFGFIGSTTKTSFTDDGVDNNVAYEPDTTFLPPSHATPFRRDDWPRRVAYHQQRQVMASTVNNPFRVTASKVGDLRDYSRHTPLVDSDAFSFRIAGLRANSVTALVSLDGLIIATPGAIWTALGDGDGSLIPSAINLRKLSHRGVGAVRPELVDATLIYADIHESEPHALRVPVGGVAPDGLGSQSLHDYAAHLFRGYTLKRLAYAAHPDSIIWALRSDGVLLGCSFVEHQGLLAWHRTVLGGTDAVIHDMAVIPEGGTDRLYALVERTIDGSPTFTVEAQARDRAGEPQYDLRLGAIFLDGAITVDGTNGTATTLTLTGGATWAAGETGLTLTASAALFPGDGSNVGNGYRISIEVDGTTYEVEVKVTADASTTVQTVTVLAARTRTGAVDYTYTTTATVAASLQGVARATWVAMVTAVSGLDHLEAEEVSVLADGVPLMDGTDLATFTVSSGAIDVGSRPYGIMHVGVMPTYDAEVHDADFYSRDGETLLDRAVGVMSVSMGVLHTRGLAARAEGSTVSQPLPMPAEPLNLQAGTERINLGGPKEHHGRFHIEQPYPLPAFVSVVIPAYSVGGRQGEAR